jgi:predicted AlkP superfamily phosphohydrolase/phosphomutase
MDALIEFGKILIPASVVLYAAYLLVRSFIQKDIDLKKLEIRGRTIETVLPNRLHAYERMTLFLERMSPQNLLVRLNTGSIPAKEFQQVLLAEVRNEYNHNVSQQVYISEEVWELIKNAKEDLIVTINDSSNEMEEDASSLDLSKKIFEKTIGKTVDPLAHALSELKREVQRIF